MKDFKRRQRLGWGVGIFFLDRRELLMVWAGG